VAGLAGALRRARAPRAVPQLHYPAPIPRRLLARDQRSGNPLFGSDGAFLGYRGTATDVTARHAAETQLGQANAKLQECIESLAEAFALYGPDNRLLLCNEQYRGLNPVIREVVVRAHA